MTAAERQARRRKRAAKSINRRRRTLYKIAVENETRKAKRARRVEILAGIAERTKAATAALMSSAMPLCNLVYLDPPWPHDNYSTETGSDRSTDNHHAPMTWKELDAFGAKLPAAPDCMLIMWTPKSIVARASIMLDRWGWDPLRTTSMIWLKMQGEKIWTGTGKRVRDQHELIIIAVRGAVPSGVAAVGIGLGRTDWRAQRETEGVSGDD